MGAAGADGAALVRTVTMCRRAGTGAVRPVWVRGCGLYVLYVGPLCGGVSVWPVCAAVWLCTV